MANLNSLLKLSTVRRYAKDAVILKEGVAAPPEMLIILQGNVGLFHHFGAPSQEAMGALGPGGYVGETTLFLGAAPAETAIAQSDLIVVAINKQNAPEFFATQPELTFAVFEDICKKRAELKSKYENLMADVRAGVATKNLLEEERKASRSSVLFPEGHGSYQLPINNALEEYLFVDNITCPVCGYSFQNLLVITSRLRRESSDPDMRVYYKDIEPMYYDIITCPSCLLSAQVESFRELSKRLAPKINDELARFKTEVRIQEGYKRDTFTIFAGYYLAIICSAVCFDDYQMVRAGLWQKLSRLYSDVGDEKMRAYATGECLKDYKYSYENFNLSEKKMQHVCYVIGDLYHRLGDLDQARNFFFMAKSNRDGTNVLKRQADIRLDEIKELIKQKASSGA